MSELIRYIATNRYSCYTITLTKPVNFDVVIDLDNQLLKITFKKISDLIITVDVSYKKIADAELINKVSKIVIELNHFFKERQVFTKDNVIDFVQKLL